MTVQCNAYNFIGSWLKNRKTMNMYMTLGQLRKLNMEWILDDIMKFVLIFLGVLIVLWL